MADSVPDHDSNDTIAAYGGNDWINGGADNDVLTGNTGYDDFVLNTALSPNVDRITDVNVAEDTIRLDKAVMAMPTAAPPSTSPRWRQIWR